MLFCHYYVYLRHIVIYYAVISLISIARNSRAFAAITADADTDFLPFSLFFGRI